MLCVSFLGIVGGAVAMTLLVRHEPDEYRQANIPAGPVRTQRSQEFVEEFSTLVNSVLPGYEKEWYIKLTDEQINSYLAEGFVQQGIDERVLPEGISDPRVILDKGTIRFAFRYQAGPIKTVITLDTAVWLCKEGEPNTVAVEILGLHAGSLPISAQSLLNSVTDALRDRGGVEVNWYRHPENGHPVALLRFQQSDQPRATVQLQSVELDKGSLLIRGKPVDGGNLRAAAMLFPGIEWQPVANKN